MLIFIPGPCLRILEEEADRVGLTHRAWLDGPALAAVLSPLEDGLARRYGADVAGSALVAALAFDEGPNLPDVADPGVVPLARLARFARADWYAELADRLRLVAEAARAALLAEGIDPGPGDSWRRLVNSRLPERSLAMAAGLGSIGRSGLLLVPGAGPGVVLGALLLPEGLRIGPERSDGRAALRRASGARPARGSACGSCRACLEACPTGALSDTGFERERCIQHWAGRAGSLPALVEAAWGNRLYGCDSCTESCPHFGNRSTIVPTRGLLGFGVPAGEIANATDGELKTRFKATVLDRSWIEPEALRRNARLALRHGRN
jgi:epoxyqueuosine reductase